MQGARPPRGSRGLEGRQARAPGLPAGTLPHGPAARTTAPTPARRRGHVQRGWWPQLWGPQTWQKGSARPEQALRIARGKKARFNHSRAENLACFAHQHLDFQVRSQFRKHQPYLVTASERPLQGQSRGPGGTGLWDTDPP